MIKSTIGRKLAARGLAGYAALLAIVATAVPFESANAEQAQVFANRPDFKPGYVNISSPWESLGVNDHFYRPDPHRSFNGFSGDADGSDIQIVQIPSAGVAWGAKYYVHVPGVTVKPRMHAMVQAVGTDNTYCWLETGDDWYEPGGRGLVPIRCTAPTAFVLRLAEDVDRNDTAYATRYIDFRFDDRRVRTTGTDTTFTRVRKGEYKIVFPNITGDAAAHVSARSDWYRTRCVANPNRSPAGFVVHVRCKENYGDLSEQLWQPSDAGFSVFVEKHFQTFHSPNVSIGGGRTQLIGNAEDWYPMGWEQHFNGTTVPFSRAFPQFGSGISIVWYKAPLGMVADFKTVPHVTATYRGANWENRYCKPVSLWTNTDTDDGFLGVACFDEEGNPSHSNFMQSMHWRF